MPVYDQMTKGEYISGQFFERVLTISFIVLLSRSHIMHTSISTTVGKREIIRRRPVWIDARTEYGKKRG
jgi:hypothetical protein